VLTSTGGDGGLWAGGRFEASGILPYVVAQVLGGAFGAFLLSIIAKGKAGFDLVQSGFAANGFAEHSPGGYSWGVLHGRGRADLLLPACDPGRDRPPGAGGLRAARDRPRLDPHHLVGIPVTNTSVNPARSTAPALFVAAGRSSSSGCSGWRRSSRVLAGFATRWLAADDKA